MDEVFCPDDRERLSDVAEVVWGRDEPIAVDEARRELESAVAVVCSDWRYGALSPSWSGLRAIIDVAGRFPPNLDYEQCFDQRVRVLTAAPAFATQVAEMALGSAIGSARGIASGDRDMRERTERWLHEGNEGNFLISGKRVGMIGFGAIGRALQPMLEVLECEITVYDPWLADGYLRRAGVRPVDLPELVTESRVIFVLAAPSAENHALLDRALLETVREDAVLVLISRAHVVDFDALTDLVGDGRFRAAIDVFPSEPLPNDHPIRDASAALLTPHRAGSVREGLWELGAMVTDDLEAIARRLPPERLQVAQPELIQRLP